jgi:hypothetical protein
VPAVQLGLDQRRNVDPVDDQVLDLAVDGGVDDLDAAHHDLVEVTSREPGPVQDDHGEPRPRHVRALELLAAEVGQLTVAHGGTD